MAAETAKREREDGREDAGFEEEDQRKSGDAGVSGGAHGDGDEDDDHGHEGHEDPARLDGLHAGAGDEAADGEEALRDGQLVAAGGGGGAGAHEHDVVDEVAGDGDLGADVAELRQHAPEERILPAQRLVDVAGALIDGLGGLVGHVGVGDFGDRREEEDDGEEEDKDGDAEINPLDGREGFAAWRADIFEDDVGGQHGRDDGADGLEGLGEVESHFAVFRGPARGDEGVRRGLEGGEAGADDEHGAAEAAKGAFDCRRPEHEGADAVDAQAGDEGPAVAEAADDPAGVG